MKIIYRIISIKSWLKKKMKMKKVNLSEKHEKNEGDSGKVVTLQVSANKLLVSVLSIILTPLF